MASNQTPTKRSVSEGRTPLGNSNKRQNLQDTLLNQYVGSESAFEWSGETNHHSPARNDFSWLDSATWQDENYIDTPPKPKSAIVTTHTFPSNPTIPHVAVAHADQAKIPPASPSDSKIPPAPPSDSKYGYGLSSFVSTKPVLMPSSPSSGQEIIMPPLPGVRAKKKKIPQGAKRRNVGKRWRDDDVVRLVKAVQDQMMKRPHLTKVNWQEIHIEDKDNVKCATKFKMWRSGVCNSEYITGLNLEDPMKWTTEERVAKAAAREAEARATKTSATEARAAEAQAKARGGAPQRWTIVDLIRLVDCVYAQFYAGYKTCAWFPFEDDFGRKSRNISDKWSEREKWLPRIDMTKEEVDANVAYLKKLKDRGDTPHFNKKKSNPRTVDMFEVHRLLKQKDDLESS